MTEVRNSELDRQTDEADNRHPSYRNAALERLERTNGRDGRTITAFQTPTTRAAAHNIDDYEP